MNSTAFAHLCPSCFAEKGSTSTCPHCGYDESQRRGPLVLPHRALLHSGQYLIGKVLGKPGGFGITYLAFDTKLETKVAIKEYLPRDLAGRDGDRATISAHSADDAEHFRYGLTQFLQEARTLARFDHANIVRVRNFFEENGTGYLVMDYYDGITLADYLAQQPQGKLPEQTAIDILMPILDGLREVHAKNFLHRDIKPQNIYLTTGNRAILLDFGAARQAMSERSRSLSVVLSEGYAPYEQYHRRGEQGPWTDIYASAAVLYHAVAGEPPPPATERVSKDELNIEALGVSTSLAKALRLGLAVDHKNRPRTMVEFQGLFLTDLPPVYQPIGTEQNSGKDSFFNIEEKRTDQTDNNFTEKNPSKKQVDYLLTYVPTSSVPFQSEKKMSLWYFALLVTILFMMWFIFFQNREMPVNIKTSPLSSTNIHKNSANIFIPTHAVAAIKANIRREENFQAPILKKIERGEGISIISSTDTFLKVKLSDGVEGFIAQGMVIPIADFERLSKLTAQEYIDQRMSEKQIERFLTQLSVQHVPFSQAIYGISNRSIHTKKYLENIESAKKFDINFDIPASTWFSATAKFLMASGFHDKGILNARAAVLADPTNGGLHVAYALAAFQEGNIKIVKTVGRVVPMLSPMTTNAWLIFGLAEALDSKEGSIDATATGAFILAIKLSHNSTNTKKYLIDIVKNTENPRLRVLISDALAEEASDPSLFDDLRR